MPAPELARKKIKALVDKFKRMPKRERDNLNESATRLSFILPLFDALERRIDELDAEIDRRVYELYGLTEEEIKIIDGAR